MYGLTAKILHMTCKYCLFLFFHSSDDSHHSTDSSSSIVFQSLSQAQTDAASDDVMPPTESNPITALVPAQDMGQVVCPKMIRRIPENYVPCVFLGKQAPRRSSKCPAMNLDTSLLLEEGSSRSSIELNNNSCIDIPTVKPSVDVCI